MSKGGELSEVEQEDNSRKKKRRVVILILLLLLLLSIGSCAMWQFAQPKADPGATVQTHEGKSDEEVIAELNRQAEESRMTISVSAKPKLADGKVRVNVSNVAENKFSQTFTLSQDGIELYNSGLIAPRRGRRMVRSAGCARGIGDRDRAGLRPRVRLAVGQPPVRCRHYRCGRLRR